MNVLDIDGYPIIRIDQIASLDTPSLRQAQQDASTLLQELRADGQPSPLVSYLCRQIESMEREVATRAAADRVQALLNGTCDLLSDRKYESVSIPAPSPKPQKIVTSSSVTSVAPSPTSLPNKTAMSQPLLPMSINQPPSSQPVVKDKPLPVTGTHDPIYEKIVTDEVPANKTASGRPPSGRARRSVAIYNENFGNAFVVAATEKKKRYFPKKVIAEDPEVAKQKARDAR